jgi:hypothetical protein
MKFSKAEFTEKVGRLEGLLENDFSRMAGAMQKNWGADFLSPGNQRLMEQLHYRDIILLKIQHVCQFGELLEEEFASCSAAADQAGEALLPGLLELCMALLQFARLEYDEIREEIQLQLLGLGAPYQPGQDAVYAQFQEESQDLIKSLGRLYLLFETKGPQAYGEPTSEKLNKICRSFSLESEREIFRSLFQEGGTKDTDLQRNPQSSRAQV